jgi:hypothetical protein
MIITAMPRVTPRIEITVITETKERFGFRYRRARKRENREVTEMVFGALRAGGGFVLFSD